MATEQQQGGGPEWTEDFSQGLVTNRDQATLNRGELTQTDNVFYRPSDHAIHKATLRTKYNSVAISGAGQVKGLRFLDFDTVTGILVAHTGSNYDYTQLSAETGSFSSLASGVGSGTALDSVAYLNQHVLLNGVEPPRVVKDDYSTRSLGLNPTVDAPTLAITASSGWNTGLGAGYYWFFVTELVNPGSTDELESSCYVPTTLIPNINISQAQLTTSGVTVTFPTKVNASATHWGIYMYGPTQGQSPVPPMNVFHRLDPVDINATSVLVGTTATGATKFPTVSTVHPEGGAQFTNPSNAFTANYVGAVGGSNLQGNLYKTYGFAVAGTITGIEVIVRERWNNIQVFGQLPGLKVQLSKDGTNTVGTSQSVAVSSTKIGSTDLSSNSWFDRHYGGQFDKWGTTWTSGEINAATFGAAIELTYAQPTMANRTGMEVDFIAIKVYTATSGSGVTVNLDGPTFQTITLSVAGVTTTLPANGPPPIATTGDMFEGQLVLNSINERSKIYYSLPNRINYFPTPYYQNFDTKYKDRVTCIRRLGNKLIVGLESSLMRVNYLPRETDAEFDRGRAYEPISESGGITGPMAAALFSPEDATLLLACVQHTGIIYTDGFQTQPITKDLDWSNTVKLPTSGDATNYLQYAILVDYPNLQQLRFFYIPTSAAPGTTIPSKCLVFHYAMDHRKQNGTFKTAGPLDINASSATIAKLAGSTLLMTGQSGGFTYVEDRGYSDASGGNPLMVVVSREMYLADIGGETRVEKLYTRHRQDATATIQVSCLTRYGTGAQDTAVTDTFTTAQACVSPVVIDQGGDSHQWKWEETTNGGTAVRLTNYSIDVVAHGKTESP